MWLVYWLAIGVLLIDPVMLSPVHVYSVEFFREVKRNWYVDRFCWQYGSGCGDEFVESGG
jgi:hypothetical protein